jgi:spore coat protein A
MPGPTIRARQGRKTVVQHLNKLPVPTVVHLHGGCTPPDSDGFPTDLVMPGKSRSYVYPNQRPGATLWYHDHSMDSTGHNLFMGLAGLYIVEDPIEKNFPLPRDGYDVPLILQDRLFDQDGALHFVPDFLHGAYSDTLLVNGAPWPHFEVAARKYRLRILNASNARSFRLALSSGRPFTQIATDGGLLPFPISIKEIPLAMAERVEVIVDFSGHSIGSQIFLNDLDRHQAILRFDVLRHERDDTVVPRQLREAAPLSKDLAVRTRTLVLTRAPSQKSEGRWAINGSEFEAERPIAEPHFGDVEIWRIANHTFLQGVSVLHPVHLHLVDFRILERNGKPAFPHESGWKDTVALESGDEVKIIMRFDGYRGRYLLHCHNLEHEDRGMMARFDVV